MSTPKRLFGDDLLLDEVEDGRMLGLGLLVPLGEFHVVQELNLADDGGVDGDEHLHGRDEERARTARGIEQAQRRQNLEQERAAEVGVEVQQQVGNGGKTAVERLVHAVEDELVDGALAQVAGHFRARVVSAEFLLVDVFLEDVAEHVGVDLVVACRRACR